MIHSVKEPDLIDVDFFILYIYSYSIMRYNPNSFLKNKKEREKTMKRKTILALISIIIAISLCATTAYADITIGQGNIPGNENAKTNEETASTSAFSVPVYEDENCQICFSKLENKSGKLILKFRVTNYTGRVLTYQSDCFAINGESLNNIGGSEEIAPNSAGTISFTARHYDEEYFDLENIRTISGNMTIIDFNDSNFHDGHQSYEITFYDVIVDENAEPTANGEQGQKFYSDDNVDISYLKAEQDGEKVNVYFRIDNKTTSVLTIQCDSLSLNGESSSRSSGSEEIAPHSTGNIFIKCVFDLDYVDLNNITSLSGQLTIIDFGNSNFYNGHQSYDVRF